MGLCTCCAVYSIVNVQMKEENYVKFANNDLMGFPYQIVCGKKAVKNGNVELKDRATGERSEVAIDEVAEKVAQLVLAARA